jgi:phosphatidate cytidylyltransferase
MSPAAAGRFADLAPRLLTAAFLLAIGGAAVWFGGLAFSLLIAACTGIMLWELATMLGAARRVALILGGSGGVAVILANVLPIGFALPLLLLVPMLGIAMLRLHRRIYMSFAVVIVLAGLALTRHLTEFGLVWTLWLILVVIASDVLGYFVGRMLGGPKFWPRVSPKKTWSGTVAGWIGAALVGVAFVYAAEAGWELVGISVALAMMAQMGDIAESAVKRKVGAKDSSQLLPGHGGLFDRFDALLGAAVMLLVIESLTEFPPLPGLTE